MDERLKAGLTARGARGRLDEAWESYVDAAGELREDQDRYRQHIEGGRQSAEAWEAVKQYMWRRAKLEKQRAALRAALDDLDEIDGELVAAFDKGFKALGYDKALTMDPSDL